MEQKLTAAVREGTGKGVARQLRAQNRVPAVLYGAGVEPTPIHVDSRDLFRVLHTDAGANVLIDLELEGAGTHLTLAREFQQDHIKGRMVHVDFVAVRRDQKITVKVSLETTGSSVGIHEGGVLEHHLWELEIECLPGNVPEHITVDITNLAVGDSLHVRDLIVPEGSEIKEDLDVMVVAVVAPQKSEEAEVAEAAAAAALLGGGEGGGEGASDAAEEGGGE